MSQNFLHVGYQNVVEIQGHYGGGGLAPLHQDWGGQGPRGSYAHVEASKAKHV